MSRKPTPQRKCQPVAVRWTSLFAHFITVLKEPAPISKDTIIMGLIGGWIGLIISLLRDLIK